MRYWYILFVAGYDNKFSETNENNNIKYVRFTTNSPSYDFSDYSVGDVITENLERGQGGTAVGGNKTQIKDLQNFLALTLMV